MFRAVLLSLPFVLLCACGDDDGGGDPGPFDAVELTETVADPSLTGWVDVVRDEFGVPHIYAAELGDLAFVQGYVQALDRAQQMHMFRFFASGRIAELFGALDRAQIDADIEMRMHRFRPVAEEAWAELEASGDAGDQETVLFLQRYADGVNRYLDDLRAGVRDIDPAVRVWFDPERVEPWTPIDSLVIGRLQAFFLSYGDRELGLTDQAERAAAAFDQADPQDQPARAARAGILADLRPMAPMDPTTTIDGWPGVPAAAPARPREGQRPRVTLELLQRLAYVTAPKRLGGGRLDHPENGSNNWVVGPDLAGGSTLMANDPHLTLYSPSVFYGVHLTVPGDLDVAGITFPGVPGVVLGHNQHLAWGATTANHDVTDFYLEEVVPCSAGGGDCVVWNGEQVAIETWTEELGIGANGTITETMTVTFERVPHHGPILPAIVDHQIAPRTGDTAISVRYTGHQVTHELKAFRALWRAGSVEEGMTGFESFGFGAQNLVLADDQGNIGWTTHALVPLRTDGCYTWNGETNPGGVAPWFVVPGDGSCEWDGWMAAANIPHAYNPDKGYLATANADPVGAIVDGDPLNEPVVGGHMLYAGGTADYAAGYRVGRVTRRIEALIDSGQPLTADDMASIQADTFSNFGDVMAPEIVAAVAALDDAGAPADVQAWAAALSAADRQRLEDAAARLDAWTRQTPPAVGGSPDAATLRDSSATVILNVWIVRVIDQVFADEVGVMGYGASTWLAPALRRVLLEPDALHTGLAAETGQPLLCDNLGTTEVVESCTLLVLRALDAALDWAIGTGFASTDMDSWRWGELHRLTLQPLIPADELAIPPPNEADPLLAGGYPRAGDVYSVDASSPGYDDTNFTYGHGPAMRHITELAPGQEPVTWLALPGGQSADRSSGHFRDLMDDYWADNEYFILPWTPPDIIAAAESRTRFSR